MKEIWFKVHTKKLSAIKAYKSLTLFTLAGSANQKSGIRIKMMSVL